MSAPCVELDNLTFRYSGGPFRLRVPELTIPHGEKTAIIGPSGSGKTTLLHLMAGILEPSSGTITVNGVPLGQRSDAQRRELRISSIGMIFQEFELLEHLTVRENMLLPFFVHGALRLTAEVEGHLERLARRAGLAGLLGRKPRGLSQGERQRVAICRALVTDPAVVLADEPTGNLDPETTEEVLSSMFDEVDEHSATLIMVTHDYSLLNRFQRTIDFQQFRERSVP